MVIIIKVCEVCGEEYEPNSNSQKYCERCRIRVQRKKIKERVKRHRLNGNKEPRERIKERVKEHREKNGLSKNHKETSKEAMERYRERWGWNNKNEQLGSGRLSKKRNEDFEIEEKIIKWEKRRLGIKEV